MKRNYIFAPYIMLGRSYKELRISDIEKITHLYIAFSTIEDGKAVTTKLSNLDKLIYLKEINPELKIIISIGGWGCDGFSQASFSQESRDIFVKSAMNLVLKWDFDGIDIDWEYPCSDQAGIEYAEYDKDNYTYLMRDLRIGLDKLSKETNKTYLLTTAVGGEQYYIDGTNMAEVNKYIDYINLMTYDLRGGFTNITGHHANMYPQANDKNGPSSERTIDLFYKAGIPYDKMILGCAFYGRMWCGVKDSGLLSGLGCKAETAGSERASFDLLDDEAVELNGYKRYFDENAKASYLFNGENFISYEDELSITEKCNYVKEKKLAGIMYWAYGRQDLFDIIDKNLD